VEKSGRDKSKRRKKSRERVEMIESMGKKKRGK